MIKLLWLLCFIPLIYGIYVYNKKDDLEIEEDKLDSLNEQGSVLDMKEKVQIRERKINKRKDRLDDE